MRPSGPLLAAFRFLFTPAILSTLYLYLFPVLQQCHFPVARRGKAACLLPGAERQAYQWEEKAPFRLLALADPQLEGDTSLPNPNASLLPSLQRFGKDSLVTITTGLLRNDVPRVLQASRKRLDLWGNDLYLAHVYRTVRWWTQPTHTIVLGDLLGSQWVGEDEFSKRSDRFWNKVFKGAEPVPRNITESSGRIEVLGADARWTKRVIAVAGNHDIGYAGDIDEQRIERFERTFGKVNWDLRFRLNASLYSSLPTQQSWLHQNVFDAAPPELRIVVLNSMNLDEPALKPELRQQSLDFLSDQLYARPRNSNAATVLLTHIPLHKQAGICVDAPFFSFFPQNQGGGIKEQNHLGREISSYILDGLLPDGKNAGTAIILNGHDHYGCDTYHHRKPSASEANSTKNGWQALHYVLSASERNNSTNTGLREITVQSMMGSFGGNAGLLSGWFDREVGEWKFEYGACIMGVQHVWWGVHVLDIIVILLAVVGVASFVMEERARVRPVPKC
ncbi:hypothetical protein BAUCODRAFT_101521 [Baudoinia panamericana UAMH 10762]|uniref:Uncharacterized protein n=1 Tax=Baudoinia panamericana (strain UAMH 10762) TaxID=717646 RepID=M2NKF4_BAUPA|nr:uncharacterized protein BAUCODRAFT_101521 [Baudoinia panamericana UAMH 10762]EMC99600.1 hypothetical protein BAUCODRAFT_101521 [Baudoinia panamericana UAMH 10762]